MELSRKEIVDFYNIMKDTNLSGMPLDCKKAFVVNAIKLQPVFEQINKENQEVVDKYKTDEYIKALNNFIEIKHKVESIENPNEEDINKLKEADKILAPLLKDLEDKVTSAISELDQIFTINLLDIPMDSYLNYLETKGKDVFFSSFSILGKLLK